VPAVAPVPGALRIAFAINNGDSHLAGSRFFVNYTGGPPTADNLNTFATAVSAAWGSHLAPLTRVDEALETVNITDLSTDSAALGAWAGSIEGTRGGNDLVGNACAIVNHQISRRYRGGRPRTYLRCGVDGDLDQSNTWTSDFQSAVLTGWQAFVADILSTTGIGIALVDDINISYYSGNRVFTGPTGRARNIPIPRATPLVDPIIDSSVSHKVGSQRRRLDL
jgi:hypothetical protein